MKSILVTPRSFAKTDDAPIRLLQDAGYSVLLNPHGRILQRDEMMALVRDVAGIIIGVDPLDEAILACAKSLRAIAKYGVGTDNIDLACAAARGIPVSITAGANTDAVADYAFAMMLACARSIVPINSLCHDRQWKKVLSGDVSGKTLGILGFGAIGKAVAQRASGFRMRVLAYDTCWDDDYADAHNVAFAAPEEIFSSADFISLHLPLTEQTRGIVDASAFARMQRSAVLVNTARGGLIDETALIRALQEKRIAAAGIDVFEQEPPDDPALYATDNLIMGSHCAAATTGAAENMSRMAAENLLKSLSQKNELNEDR